MSDHSSQTVVGEIVGPPRAIRTLFGGFAPWTRTVLHRVALWNGSHHRQRARTHNPTVAGSSPAGPTTRFIGETPRTDPPPVRRSKSPSWDVSWASAVSWLSSYWSRPFALPIPREFETWRWRA